MLPRFLALAFILAFPAIVQAAPPLTFTQIGSLEGADGVSLGWTLSTRDASAQVAGIRILRDSEEIARLEPDTVRYLDPAVAGEAAWPERLRADVQERGVRLGWILRPGPRGPVHRYEVEAILPDGTSIRSRAVHGARGPAPREVVVLRDGSPIATLAPGVSEAAMHYVDEGPHARQHRVVLEATQGTSARVILSWEIMGAATTTHVYQVQAGSHLSNEARVDVALEVPNRYRIERDGQTLAVWGARPYFTDNDAGPGPIASPTGFTAIAEPDGVRLSWDPPVRLPCDESATYRVVGMHSDGRETPSNEAIGRCGPARMGGFLIRKNGEELAFLPGDATSWLDTGPDPAFVGPPLPPGHTARRSSDRDASAAAVVTAGDAVHRYELVVFPDSGTPFFEQSRHMGCGTR